MTKKKYIQNVIYDDEHIYKIKILEIHNINLHISTDDYGYGDKDISFRTLVNESDYVEVSGEELKKIEITLKNFDSSSIHHETYDGWIYVEHKILILHDQKEEKILISKLLEEYKLIMKNKEEAKIKREKKKRKKKEEEKNKELEQYEKLRKKYGDK